MPPRPGLGQGNDSHEWHGAARAASPLRRIIRFRAEYSACTGVDCTGMCKRGKTVQDVLFTGPALRADCEVSPKGRETIRRGGLAVRAAGHHPKDGREQSKGNEAFAVLPKAKKRMRNADLSARSYRGAWTAARQRAARVSISSQRLWAMSSATNSGATNPVAKQPARIQSAALCSSTPLVGTIFR